MLQDFFFTFFIEFQLFTQFDYFAKDIAHALGPILNKLSFLEYLMFFEAVFLNTTTLMCFYSRFLNAL